jgi:superfamily II DNA or RNA helicase
VKLRDYQVDAANAACQSWDSGNKRVLLTLATGLGKTIIFAELARLFVDSGRGRALVIAPSIELVGQAAAKIERVTGQRVAIEQGSNWSNETEAARTDYVVSCKASLVSPMKNGEPRYKRIKDIGIVIVDEAHYSATDQYREILDHYDCPALGLTATPNRHDGVALDGVYDSAPFVMGIREGIDNGWLVAPKTHCLQLESLDLSAVKTTRSDFVASDLAKAMEQEKVVYEVAAATASEAGDFKTIVFCASVEQARKIASVLTTNHGIKSDFVCGDKKLCPDDTRESILSSFVKDPSGVQAVCNVGVLTTGFDFPGLQHIVMARPTKSTPLFTQIFGRGTRALDGVVDFPESTAEARRLAIANSGKPSWKFTDLRDMSLQHELVTPVDVLGGTRTVEELDRAKRILSESPDARDIDEVLDQASKEVREARLEAERQRLAAIQAQAKFNRVAVDPFVDAFRVSHSATPEPKEAGARMLFGKYKGELIRNLPKGYLVFMLRQGALKKPWMREAAEQALSKEYA